MKRFAIFVFAVLGSVAVACAWGAEPDRLYYVPAKVDAQDDGPLTVFSRVETKAETSVSARASADATNLAKQPAGARGATVAGPVLVSGVPWWQVDFDEGPDGWCSAADLIDRTPHLPAFSLQGCFRAVHGPDAKTVTLGKDGIDTPQQAIDALAPKGGVISIPPGTYRDQVIHLGKHMMDVTVRGILSPHGERPKFVCTDSHARGMSVFMGFGESAYTNAKAGIPAPPSGNQALLENLDISGYGEALALGNCSRFVLVNCRVHDSKNNLIGSAHLHGTQRCSLEFFGNDIYHGGQGNTKHNLYLHRGAGEQSYLRVVFINNHCHSANGSSCLKCLANENIIIGNLFETASSAEPDKHKYSSTFLVDIPSASYNLIACNTFNYGGANLSHAAIAIRRRQAEMLSADRPKYGSKEFMSPGFWKAVTGRGVDAAAPQKAAANPFLFCTWIFGNTFTCVDKTGESTVPAIVNWGTAPQVPAVSFGPPLPLRRPEAWIERSRLWVANNTYNNVTQRYRDLADTPGHFASQEEFERNKDKWLKETDRLHGWTRAFLDWSGLALPKGKSIIPVGGEDGNPVELPTWFPRVNLDDLPESIKAEWKSRPRYGAS